ncbi:hypothetical protein GOP47_0025341 [Adiantum capillus-veneris]|uniref:Uncharacterized protein n=1 Tax=Adiantum capillus-veneris TaxID=13818 RepID=A0A9D4U0U3_ADICA|nr:hypothetical protein GOP47_0025341 [Adiantum capillus-veneris]
MFPHFSSPFCGLVLSSLSSTYIPDPNLNKEELAFDFEDDLECSNVGKEGVQATIDLLASSGLLKLPETHFSPSFKSDLSPKLLKKLAPKLKRSSPSKALRKALSYARGNPRDSSSAFVAAKESDEPISDNFGSQLALVPSLSVLSISEFFDAITFRFAFEGKVLCKYGTYKIPKASYARHLKDDLIDRESKNTVTFVVTEVFVHEFVESFEVGEFVRIEGTIKELLTNKTVIEFAPTIAFTVVKVETSTRSDGGDSYRLTIADGPASSDRASLLFVPSMRVDYHLMIDALKTKGSFSCVAHNINVFKAASSILFVVDATLICALPKNLKSVFSQHLSKQVTSMGFGKKVFGTLEIVNINSLEVEYVCDSCKGRNVSRQICNPFCYSCGNPVQIVKLPSLQAKICLQNGEAVQVIMQGNIVDVVLNLPKPFLSLFYENLLDLKSSLVAFSKAGTYSIDKHGFVIDHKAP